MRRCCPECGHRFSLGRYLKVKSWLFNCPQCGVSLHTHGSGRSLLLTACGTGFMAIPISQAFDDPRWLWGLIPALILQVLWGYWFFQPVHASRASGGAASPRA